VIATQSAADGSPVVATPARASVVAPAPAVAPSGRSVMVSMSGDDGGSPVLAIVLTGAGLLLSLGATAVAVAARRERKAPATARRQ